MAPLPSEHHQRQKAQRGSGEHLAVVLQKLQVSRQSPAVVALLLALPVALQGLLAGLGTKFLPADQLRLPGIIPLLLQLSKANQLGGIGTAVGGQPLPQPLNRHRLQPQPGPIPEHHRQAAAPALSQIQLALPLVKLPPLPLAQGGDRIGRSAPRTAHRWLAVRCGVQSGAWRWFKGSSDPKAQGRERGTGT